MVLSIDEFRLIPPWLHIVAAIVMIASTIILLWSYYG